MSLALVEAGGAAAGSGVGPLAGVAIIFVLGVGAQWLALQLKIPSILLLLILGFVAGPVTGIIDPDGLFGDALLAVVPLGVGIILFEGGASLHLSDVTGHGAVVRRLITWAVLVVWAVTTGAAIWILQLDSGVALLLGAVLTVSGPTVVGPLLRAVRPSKRVRTILNWEGILIDPVGAILAVIVFDLLVEGDGSIQDGLAGLLATMAAGTFVGVTVAALITFLLRRYLIPDRIQVAVMLMFVLGAFAISDVLRPESGLIAVTLMGMALANQTSAAVDHIVEFKEILRDLLIAALFIVLAARLELDDFLSVGWREFAFLASIVLVARPLAVWVATLGSELDLRERLFMSWVAPRGIVAAAVASVFGIALVEEGVPDAERLAPLTFFVIIGTVALYSLTAKFVGRRLGVVSDEPKGLLVVGANPVGRALASAVRSVDVPVALVASNNSEMTKARMEGLDAFRASVLDDEAEEDQNIVLVATPNDEFNALAAMNAMELRGRAHVYQLAPSVGSDQVALRLRARLLGGHDFSFISASEKLLAGGQFKATAITEQFSFEDYLRRNDNRVTPLFVIDGQEIVGVFTEAVSPSVSAGQTLVSLVASSDSDRPTVDPEETTEAIERANVSDDAAETRGQPKR